MNKSTSFFLSHEPLTARGMGYQLPRSITTSNLFGPVALRCLFVPVFSISMYSCLGIAVSVSLGEVNDVYVLYYGMMDSYHIPPTV